MSNNKFNFDAYNSIMAGANSGLKLFLAQQMLADVFATMSRFRNPLANDVNDVLDELDAIRTESKKQAALRDKQGPTTTEIASTTSADGGKVS